MNYDAKKEWTKSILNAPMARPSEDLIRMLKGEYPRLNLKKNGFRNKTVCELGCGEGRNLPLLAECEFKVCATEITDPIVQKVKQSIEDMGVQGIDYRTGFNHSIPYDNEYFDYLISWNACYYMGPLRDFSLYVDEFARVMKKDSYLLLSIPKKTCFIYKGSETLKPGFQVIKNDPFNIRNGEVLRMFEDEEDIQTSFSKHFDRFIFASTHDDFFGYDYHWHLAVAQRK